MVLLIATLSSAALVAYSGKKLAASRVGEWYDPTLQSKHRFARWSLVLSLALLVVVIEFFLPKQYGKPVLFSVHLFCVSVFITLSFLAFLKFNGEKKPKQHKYITYPAIAMLCLVILTGAPLLYKF